MAAGLATPEVEAVFVFLLCSHVFVLKSLLAVYEAANLKRLHDNHSEVWSNVQGTSGKLFQKPSSLHFEFQFRNGLASSLGLDLPFDSMS